MKRKLAAAAAAGVVVVAGAGTAVWAVTGENEVEERGMCGATGAAYVLSAEQEDDVWEGSFEVQGAQPGQTWTVRIDQGDRTLVDSERTTDEDGEVDADVYLDRTDAGTLTASAAGPDGVTCEASVDLG